MIREKRLQGKVTTGRWTLPVVILICAVCWLVSSSLTYGMRSDNSQLPFGLSDELLTMVPEWLCRLTGFAVFAAIGYFLVELNNVYAIIRTRATVQTSFFFLLVAACPAIYTDYAGTLTTIPLVLSIFMLFRSYHAYSDSPQYIFPSFALLAIATMLTPKAIYLVPVWLIAMGHFQSLTLRSVCAAIIGMALPYWFLLAHAAFYGQMELFTAPFIEMVSFSDFGPSSLPVYAIATLAFLSVLYVGSFIQYLTESYKDKLQIRAYLGFMLLLWVYCLALVMLQPLLFSRLIVSMMVISAMLTAHLFVLTNTKVSNLFFITVTVALALLFTANLIAL
jgi:hypothetical protein